jgi:hypothetical protein
MTDFLSERDDFPYRSLNSQLDPAMPPRGGKAGELAWDQASGHSLKGFASASLRHFPPRCRLSCLEARNTDVILSPSQCCRGGVRT